MPRVSAFKGNFTPNARPFVTLAPDAFVAIQGETTVIGCGECRREININQYLTSLSTEASVDSPPGSATINLSIPDTDFNNFYVNDQFLIVPMMEIEIYAKGYYVVGGFPQYYRIFWGLVSTVTKSWSNGTTSISISCRDILRWWELTQTNINAAWMNPFGSSTGAMAFWGNQFAGANPTTVIITLARDAMGDFSHQTGSFQQFLPEQGAEGGVIASYARDIMAYWQLKFSNIWNNLVIYGTSGQAYTFSAPSSQVSPLEVSKKIFEEEAQILHFNKATEQFKIQPSEIAVAKYDIDKAPDFKLFEAEQRSKLSIATDARDQACYEFYCDTTGDIVFKPPFYNLNVIPNKPVSWINDFEIIDDSVTDSEAEVFTHISSSGNAFGGLMDAGLSDEITTQRTGAIDYHLLRRYGWRRLDYQVEWAANAKKLYFHLLDYLDRINAKRQNGSITIPMRPELRMGFPVWIPKYDSFFYVQAISHNFSIGGQATTNVSLTAKRSKFVAPKNIGKITRNKDRTETIQDKQFDKQGKVIKTTPRQIKVNSYKIEFPDSAGKSSGAINDPDPQKSKFSEGAVIRDPNTGKILGFPNVVMTFRSALNGEKLANISLEAGKSTAMDPKRQATKSPEGSNFNYNRDIKGTLSEVQFADKQTIINRLRSHRYEAAMSNIGAYDYAWDEKGDFKEITIVPTDSINWGPGTKDPDDDQGAITIDNAKERQKAIEKDTKEVEKRFSVAQIIFNEANKILKAAQTKVRNDQSVEASQALILAQNASQESSNDLDSIKKELASTKEGLGKIKKLPKLSIMVRPVSDEFGFEVIGHNRYGRGAFIDLGKIQVKSSDTGKIANQLGIQFAQTGGFLSSSIGVTAGVQGPGLQSLSETYDRMAPEDYQTGASFSGMIPGDKDTAAEINITSQETYAQNIRQSKGKQVFVEADATRRALTLAELSPTLTFGALSDSIVECKCMLGKTNWLSILPKKTLERIIRGSNPEVTGKASSINKTEGDAAAAADILENSNVKSGINIDSGLDSNEFNTEFSFQDPGGFFRILNDYLINDVIVPNYEINARREKRDIQGEREVFAPPKDTTNNILPDPGNSLFSRAALGDPDAIKTLQNNVNFNFGLTEKGLKEFKSGIETSKAKLSESLANLTEGNTKSIFSATTSSPSKQALKDAQDQLSGANNQLNRANKLLAANPNSARARNAVNEARNNVSSVQTQVNILQNSVNTGVSPPQFQPTSNPPMIGDILNSTKFSAASGDVFIPPSAGQE